MSLKKLLETHREQKEFYRLINKLCYECYDNYSHAIKKLSDAYFIMNGLKNRIPEKKITRMEHSLFMIERNFEDAYFRGAFG